MLQLCVHFSVCFIVVRYLIVLAPCGNFGNVLASLGHLSFVFFFVSAVYILSMLFICPLCFFSLICLLCFLSVYLPCALFGLLFSM